LLVVSVGPAQKHADFSRASNVGPASFAGPAIKITPVNYPEQQMSSSGIPDLVAMIRAMMSAYTPFMLLAPFLITNLKQGLQLIGDGLNGRQRRSASLLGVAITCLSIFLGWSSYCSLLICVSRFIHGASLDAEIQAIEDLPQALLWFVDLSPWLIVGISLALLIVVRLLDRSQSKKAKSRRERCRGETERRVRGSARRTNFVSEEEWRTFADIKASITGQKGESAVAREIARLGLPALHDVILSDSRGVTQVDHLVLGRDAIIVIETKAFAGFITGDLQGQQWTQHLAGGTMRNSFQNPARQNYRHCSAVREILVGFAVPVHGYIVSAGTATFCEELVSKVVPLKRLSDLFLAGPQSPTDSVVLRAAWERLVSAADQAEQHRNEHLQYVRSRGRSAA
jgi:hypothetical protein